MTTDRETLFRFYGAEFPDLIHQVIERPRPKPQPIRLPRPLATIAWGRSLPAPDLVGNRAIPR
jgi:hypothetical protein